MPTFKLDDREIPFEPGESILRAAHRAGIDIPHYCWHPGLSVAANCRMCLVELAPPPGGRALMLDVLEWDAEKQDYVPARKPKLVPACQQPAVADMDVRSDSSEHVRRARSAVQEFLLLNHPVDCPICDQAGECRLQDYWLEHQRTPKRMRDEPIHKPKAVPFGPTIVYDAERCILCTRCIRVCSELAKDPVLSVRERGNLGEITVAPGRRLDHAYTLMTEYVCPVGALTAIDFRFKARVWFLRSARTVCVGCATGCNSFTDYDPRHQKVYRYRPRENQAVNKYWMCDEGMLDYLRIHKDRVLEPRVRGEAAIAQAAVQRAVEIVRQAPKGRLGVVLSAQHSSEDNFVLYRLAKQHLGVTQFFVCGRADGEGDDVLRHTDKNPNLRGVKAIVAEGPGTYEDLCSALESEKVTHVLALGSRVNDASKVEPLKKAAAIVTLATHEGPLVAYADVVLPVSSWAEEDGTFVNAQGLAQRSERAIAPQGQSRPGWRVLAELAIALGHPLGLGRLRDIHGAMAEGEATGARGAAE